MTENEKKCQKMIQKLARYQCLMGRSCFSTLFSWKIAWWAVAADCIFPLHIPLKMVVKSYGPSSTDIHLSFPFFSWFSAFFSSKIDKNAVKFDKKWQKMTNEGRSNQIGNFKFQKKEIQFREGMKKKHKNIILLLENSISRSCLAFPFCSG